MDNTAGVIMRCSSVLASTRPPSEWKVGDEDAARKMLQIYGFDAWHADGIRHADLLEGERVLSELIYECQRSLVGIEQAKLDLEARGWARVQGLKE